MADIVRRIPWELSSFGGTGVGGSYALQDYQFDYALGGIPFLSATRDKGDHEWAYTERMAEIRKDQFDNFAEPGEQSIYGWWLRSQSSFTAGAGILYQDPDNDNQFNYRFADSLGVNPWTAGEVSLLRETSSVRDIVGVTPLTRGYVDPSGLDAAWITDGDELLKVDSTGGITGGPFGFGAIQGLTSSGYTYIFSTPTAIRTGTDIGASTSLYTYTATNTTVAFVKARLCVAVDNAIWLAPLDGTPGSIGDPGAGTNIYTHPNPNWIWTSITEGPNAIYVAGNDGTTGAIFKFILTQGGEELTTYIGSISAQMPTGERINTIYGYIGSFVGIATSKGFRVGEIDGQGDVVYGPLLFEITGGCRGITGFDRFMWTGSTNQHDGVSGLYRIDLGSTIQEQTTQAIRYAYARDVYGSDTFAITGVDNFGSSNRKIFVTNLGNAWLESATDLVESGYLRTGRIRFNTEEPKLYKFVSLRAPIPLEGDLALALLTMAGQEIPYITYGPTFHPGTGDVGTPDPSGPQNWIALKFTLSRNDTDPTVGAVLNGWQVKALPGSIRQRIITQTFLLFDKETDKGGQRMGFNGYARERLQDFQALARAGDVVVWQELADDLATLVIIDDWQYTQMAPPGPNGESLGGYLTVVLRTVAEST